MYNKRKYKWTKVAPLEIISLIKYHSHSQIDTNYWRELGLAIDSINELESEAKVKARLNTIISRLPVSTLNELKSLYSVTFDAKAIKEDMVKAFLGLEKSKKLEIIILQEFLNRKRRSINEVYSFKSNTAEESLTSSIGRLKEMFSKSPKLLMECFTYNNWSEKGTGSLFSYNKKVPYKEFFKLTKEYRDTFADELFKLNKMNNNYKVHSYYLVENKEIIISLYKQINDAPKADFDGAIRNKEVTNIMFSINTAKQIIEIKNGNQTDEKYIKTYLQNTFGIKISHIESKAFEDYVASNVQQSFVTGKSVSETETNLLTTRITFRTTLLNRTPRMSLELDNESIWPSVTDAALKGTVSVKSIKDIENMTVKLDNKQRVIRSVLLPNGNVIFSLDDSKMDNSTKESFKKEFLQQFGIPLFQEISNIEFFEGKADKIDYFMSLSKGIDISINERPIVDELLKQSLIIENKSLTLTCTSCRDVTEIEDITYNTDNFHCDCENNKCHKKVISKLEVDIGKVQHFVKEKLTPLITELGYKYAPRISTYNIDDESFEFLNMVKKETNETLQFFITQKQVRPAFLKRLSTMMIPTVIITTGMVDEAVQSLKDKGVQALNFGQIYLSSTDELRPILNDVVESIKRQAKTSISVAADNAYDSLQRLLCDPKDISKKYTDKVFEDDVFALLKDIIPNGVKWGKEKSGKVFPEGIFAISTRKLNKVELTRVFSFDCKFTRKNTGYDLKIEEQRKALDYVERLNANDYVINFSDKSELTSHIFISNKFKSAQINGMRKFFNEKLDEDYNTRPIFIDVESFLFLHESYRKNSGQLSKHRNRFYEQLILLFTREEISKEVITEMFKKVLDKDLEEHKTLDTKKVTDLLDGE